MAEHVGRDEDWAGLIYEWRASGLSQKEFCRRRGLADRALYQWLYKSPYRERIAKILAAGLQGDLHPETPRFVPVSVVTMTSASNVQHVSVSASAIEIVLPGGPRIVVTPGFDAETLRRVVAVLEAESNTRQAPENFAFLAESEAEAVVLADSIFPADPFTR